MEAMLAESVSGARANNLITNNDWWAEQKLDGHRVLMIVIDGAAWALNRRGEEFKGIMNARIASDFADPRWKGRWVLDGEALNDRYYIFDIAWIGDNPIYEIPYKQRREFLETMFKSWQPKHCELVRSYKTSGEKAFLVDQVNASHGEGVMFKHVDGEYLVGRRSHRLLKWKFVKTCEAVVTEVGRKGKSSIALGLYEDGKMIDVGACTMSARNLANVNEGDVVEIRYLYCGNGGRLYQPAFMRKRNDKSPSDCTTDQLVIVNKEVVP